jgi:hypothetical protein
LRRYTPLRPKARKLKKGVVKDPEYLAWIHTQACLVHGYDCPMWATKGFIEVYGAIGRDPSTYRAIGGTFNRLEAHHVGKPRNDRRAIPLCLLAHQYSGRSDALWKPGGFEVAIGQLNADYEFFQRAA